MIDDLMDVNRIISGKVRLDQRRVDLGSILDEAVASGRPSADARGVRIVEKREASAEVQGDANRLQQVVWNLLMNAVKFTPPGGVVEMVLRRTGHHALIQVTDSGQGIPADLLPEVFEPFRQDDSSTRHAGGLGLGLAIVRSLVEMHGGEVEAASKGEGFGSTFSVRLPLAAAGLTGGRSTPASDEVPVAGPTLLLDLEVLVVDDEPDARELVSHVLEEAGARVRAAATAHEALKFLEDGYLPHVIVSDIGLPGLDGYQLMQRVRNMPGRVASTPAAAVTALTRLEDRRRALLSGYQTHLAKPVDSAELIATVASLTGRTGGGLGPGTR
jgi:CheY-like chemotaxis protein/two-component sensor histidine kinase